MAASLPEALPATFPDSAIDPKPTVGLGMKSIVFHA